MFALMKTTLARFRREESGLALTEYLILLGLLTAVVITAVVLFGTELGANWTSWGEWMRDEALEAPATTTTTTTTTGGTTP